MKIGTANAIPFLCSRGSLIATSCRCEPTTGILPAQLDAVMC